MKSYDVKIGTEALNFGPKGGITLGKAVTEPGQPLTVQTLTIPSFHHGPGQLVSRDPAQYWRGFRVDTTRPGLVLPAGGTDLRHATADAVFDGGIHGSGWCQVNDKVFLITPIKLYELKHTDNTFSVVFTNGAGIFFTGSWARWRGKVIFPREKAPAAPLGGDSTTRYAETPPVIFDIATAGSTNPSPAGAFTTTLGAGYYCSHIVSGKGSVWWIQNRGRFAAPRLYWSDDTETDFGSFAAGRLYGPFDIEQGGYCTKLHLAGPHILLFKRDGSIIGVDESKIWTSYSPERGPINDDLFGSSLVQYLSLIVLNSDVEGALVFNPANLGLDSIEPSRVQKYVASSDDNFIQKTSTFAVRGTELFAFGKTPNGVAMYTGINFQAEGFFYASDYGVYATDEVVAAPGTSAFTLRSASGGSKLRSTTAGGQRTLRKIVATTVFNESPVSATIYRHMGGVDHHHLFVAHRVEANDKLKIYQIDLAPPGWQAGPPSLAPGFLYTSRIFTPGGVTALPLRLRGFSTTGPGMFCGFSLGVEEGSPEVLGALSTTGMFVLEVQKSGTSLMGVAGRYFQVVVGVPPDADFRLETPLYLDVLTVKGTEFDADHVTLTVTVGDNLDNLGNTTLAESPHNIVERLLALQDSQVAVEMPWETVWQVWVEDVAAQQIKPEDGVQQSPGQYAVSLQCRRLE